ncbi:MAG: patatin family protein [Fusicatenibacter sp.]|nr:patatin family protein [Fusicatenibacter sp.]
MKKGLILEGGAMRGMFTAGVMDVMLEHQIEFDGAIGVSAGAAFGCNYKSKQKGRALRYNLKFCRDKRYCSVRSLIRTGDLYNTDFCYREVPLKYDVFDFAAYQMNPMEFYVVCTDIVTGEAVYHRYEGMEDHGFDWIRASASMPVVSQIVKIDGREMLDGGIADSIPVRYFESIGYDRNVVVLTRPLDYRKERNGLMPIIKRKYREYPKLIKAMEVRHEQYNETLDYIAKEENEGKLLVLRPEQPLPVSRVEKNPEKLKAAYEIGRETAIRRMNEILQFLE